MIKTIQQRLVGKTKIQENGCLIWTGAMDGDYPAVGIDKKKKRVHQLLLTEKLERPITPGLCALHTCDNKLCVNQDHIYEGTHAQNRADAVRNGRVNLYQNRKLSDEQVESIRREYADRQGKKPKVTLRSLAAKYNVSFSMIDAIVKKLRRV